MRKQKPTVRFTIDLPQDLHKYLKMLATKEGVSLKQFVIEHLPNMEPKKNDDIPQDEFDHLLKEMIKEKSAVLKRLSKK